MLVNQRAKVDKEVREKVLSVMPSGKTMRLSEIIALSGFSQDSVLRMLVTEEWAGTVQRVQSNEKKDAFWRRI